MHASFDFLHSVFGVDQSAGNHLPSPVSTLAAIDSGALLLPSELMETTQGADLLCVLITKVCKTGIEHISFMDAHYNRKQMDANGALVERLIQHGVDPWMASSDGQSGWDKALSLGWEGAALSFLSHPSAPAGRALGMGSMLKEKAKQPTPWLNLATENNMLMASKKLIEAAANPSATDENGNTPLHLAKSAEMVAMLLKAGADASLTNHDNGSIETMWGQSVRKELITGVEHQKMASELLFAAPGAGDVKKSTADTIANSGLSMGVRDGGALLKKAGWNNPKQAVTSRGTTIFFERVAHLLANNFCDGDRPGVITRTTILKRVQQATSWIDKDAPLSDMDTGALRLLMWSSRKAARTGNEKEMEADTLAIETALGQQNTYSASSQRLALAALDKMVGDGRIWNGSEVAGYALKCITQEAPAKVKLLETGDEGSLYVSWMKRIYQGARDPKWWDAKNKNKHLSRPDAQTEWLEAQLEDYLPNAFDPFWQQEGLAAVVINRIGKSITSNKDEAYLNPQATHVENKSPGDVARLERFFMPWVERVDPNAMCKELDHPHSRAIFQVAKNTLPLLATRIEGMLLGQVTQVANAPKIRRGL
jgi:hypothetical protein